MARKLPWPMTRIERDVLHDLWLEAKRTGQPITVVVKAAVDEYLSPLRNLHMDPAAQSNQADPGEAA
jgi:hypothetical protein